MSTQSSRTYQFGSFTVDVPERLLLSNGEPVDIPPKIFDTLVLLVESKGRLVQKDDLMANLWPDARFKDLLARLGFEPENDER